ncbi:MAG: hypothetical protein JWP12_2234 [Bacteroidetes bacterium]|nr:hypothetical protein [Bacteroidota bacterium]
MLFNSLQFLLFFFAFFFILFSIPQNLRKPWLLIASCYFYMVFKPVYLLILVVVIAIDYFAGRQIEKSSHHKKSWLVISLVSNIGILVFYKYYNFLNDTISVLLNLAHVHNHLPVLDIILPIGLSFHTFQAMSYTIEVYRGNQKAETNFLNYSLYVLYFPQLVAGPIERPQQLLPKFRQPIVFKERNLTEGIFRIACGVFKKVVIADRLTLFVDPVFDHIYPSNGLSVLIATVFFAFEIYCDFSGYTDIALGVSNIMGIRLVENFKSPYLSTSISEFWTRWHISLSSWFRDYVYIPLGGNRTSRSRWVFNIGLVFLLSGLWHGARWNFVVWGALHGFLLISERMIFQKIKWKIPAFLKIIFVFCSVCIAWIFFRVKEVKDAFVALDHLFHLSVNNTLPAVFNRTELIFCFALIAGLVFTERFIKRSIFKTSLSVIMISCCLLLLSYLFGEFNAKQFIYFQF